MADAGKRRRRDEQERRADRERKLQENRKKGERSGRYGNPGNDGNVPYPKVGCSASPRPGVAGQPVLPHPQPGRADGEIFRLLQQRLTGKTTEGKQRRGHPLHPRTPGDEKIFRRNWARWIQKIGACPGEGDCVAMSESTINIQNLLITLDSVSRFACTE